MASALIELLVPPRCGVCAASSASGRVLCLRCERELAAGRPLREARPPLDLAVAAAAYSGAARGLAHGLKYGRRHALAATAAATITRACPPAELTGTLVPVPPAPLRGTWRGFDPAEEIALALGRRTGLPLRRCLRRRLGPRQVGRPRGARLADPPRIELRSPAPRSVLLVDDVHTTGATLAACARALRRGGAARVVALTLARSIAPPRPG